MKSSLIRPTHFITLIAGVIAIALATTLFFAHTTHAADAKNFDPGRIIDDAIFYNGGSMTATQIQTFLNAKNPNCDTNGTKPASDWGRPDITRATLASYIRNGTHGYSKDTAFHAPPYTCTKNYKQNTPQMGAASGLCGGLSAKTNRTAAQIIKDVSDACGINPQVLLVLLQKEQSLITDTWPLNRQYQKATGFDCPDTAPCDPAYAGFFYQVYHAARQFKIYKAYPNNYNYVAGRTNRIYWHPDLSRCGSSQVYIENQATAALYIYTPYRPNSAALNNLYGTGDSCSSYGNRNFWRLFTDWFGSTLYKISGGIGTKYTSLGGASVVGMPKSNEIKTSTGGVYQLFDNGRIYWKNGVGAWYVSGGIGNKYIALGADRSDLGYPSGNEVKLASGLTYQPYENGRIYWKSQHAATFLLSSIDSKYQASGLETGALGYPTTDTLNAANSGKYQVFPGGRIYWSQSTGTRTVTSAMLNAYNNYGYDTGFLGLPSGDEASITGGTSQAFQNGQIYLLGGNVYETHGGIHTLYRSLGLSSGTLGRPTANEVSIPEGVYQQFENGRIYWTSKSGAVATYGRAYTTYTELGANAAYLGIPTSNPTATYQQFSNGRIYFSDATSYIVSGGIYNKFLPDSGYLGAPLSNEVSISGGVYQQFSNGRIYWSSKSGAVQVSGGIGNKYLALGAERSRLGLPKSEELKTTNTTYQLFTGGKITWTPSGTTVSYN